MKQSYFYSIPDGDHINLVLSETEYVWSYNWFR